MAERLGPDQSEHSTEESSLVDPEYVDYAFNMIHNYRTDERFPKPGRKPTQAGKIREVFRNRESEFIPLDDFAAAFAGTKDPRMRAASAIDITNQMFEKLDLALEIEGITISGRRTRRTLYRLRKWPHE
jgi:hypothetical protein